MSKKKKTIIPKTLEEAYAQLDAMLSDEDKVHLVEDEGAVINAHFSLGLWIRNNWLYQMGNEELKLFLKPFSCFIEIEGGPILMPLPDEISDEMIERYVEYLKGNHQS
ncbi:MAG: hypothetical protein J6Y97_14290 [Prevotella sp.]|nr:hypothetical protein [Prevotella sp.]MBP5507506.1 hypothetical protein [Prevotella sp.]